MYIYILYIYYIYIIYIYIITVRKTNTANDSISSSNNNISDYGDEIMVVLKLKPIF